MTNMRDVASLAGVSVSTVSAVLNDNKFVSPDIREKVEDAIQALDYHKKIHAKNNNDNEVAVILPGIGSSFFNPLLNGISTIANTRQLTISIYDTNRVFSRESEFVRSCAERGIKNIIVDSVCDMAHESEYFSHLKQTYISKYGMHIAVVERQVKTDGFGSVYVDNFSACYDITSHLIETGCKRIAHIGGAQVFPNTQIRQDAFIKAMRDHGIEPNPLRMLKGDFTPISGYGLVQDLMDKGIAIDGIFAANDQMAIGAMKALINAGRRIPDDVAVAGFDNLAISSVVSPGLTTVQFPIFQMGAKAASIIADLRDGKETNMDVKLESRLIIRGSTKKGVESDWAMHGW